MIYSVVWAANANSVEREIYTTCCKSRQWQQCCDDVEWW